MKQFKRETVYNGIGGYKKVEEIVETFYGYVKQNPVLIPLFPEDLTETMHKQKLFLIQFFGGPRLYEEERGHPMLRRRHLPFPITPSARDAWLACMNQSLIENKVEEPYYTEMIERLTLTANHMMNTPES
ncbi:globin [Oceanobacillus sojae]|uniref:globin domain-containing protein n=1 Tax=Oceanobacillus sojae TaxID=582851 RepID=UPI0021A26D29|nr:globin [Oceanobacillus sojae]MCT1904029.1 globin [Oceanobacillus sojae]